MSKQVIESKLEQLLDDYRDWKRIYGQVPVGYEEPKDRAKERRKFEEEIAALRKQLQVIALDCC